MEQDGLNHQENSYEVTELSQGLQAPRLMKKEPIDFIVFATREMQEAQFLDTPPRGVSSLKALLAKNRRFKKWCATQRFEHEMSPS